MPVHQNQCSTKCLKCLGQIGIREHPFEVNRWRAYLFSTISVPQYINRLLGTSEKGRGWLPIQFLYSCKKNICLLLYKSISPIAPPPPPLCSGAVGAVAAVVKSGIGGSESPTPAHAHNTLGEFHQTCSRTVNLQQSYCRL